MCLCMCCMAWQHLCCTACFCVADFAVHMQVQTKLKLTGVKEVSLAAVGHASTLRPAAAQCYLHIKAATNAHYVALTGAVCVG